MNKELLLLTILGYDMKPQTAPSCVKFYNDKEEQSGEDVLFFNIPIGPDNHATIYLHRDDYLELRKRNYRG